MNVSLKSLPGDESVRPKSYLLNSGSTLIGRADNCSLRLDCPTISLWHCIVDVAPGGVYITDLHSLNGTYVNDCRAVRQPLGHADVLRLGGLSFLVGVDSDKELRASAQEYALAVGPSLDRYSQSQPEPEPLQASSIAALLPKPIRKHRRTESFSKPKSTRRVPYAADDLAQQVGSYEKALINCTAQLKLLSQKVAALQSRLNALSPADQAGHPQRVPKKAFERHDALMYIARAAIHEKIRRQSTSSSSASA